MYNFRNSRIISSKYQLSVIFFPVFKYWFFNTNLNTYKHIIHLEQWFSTTVPRHTSVPPNLWWCAQKIIVKLKNLYYCNRTIVMFLKDEKMLYIYSIFQSFFLTDRTLKLLTNNYFGFKNKNMLKLYFWFEFFSCPRLTWTGKDYHSMTLFMDVY